MVNKFVLALFAVLAMLSSCNDDTSVIGVDVMPGNDRVEAKVASYDMVSRTVEAGAVLANTATCYLGSMVDPELNVRTTCDFLTQFHVPDNFAFPEKTSVYKDDNGEPVADSCDIRIYIDSHVGDSLATMKLTIHELDKNNTLEESENYYTDLDPKDYISANTECTKTITYTVKDLTRPNSETTGTTTYREIDIRLPQSYATNILKAYYEHPEYFTDSYKFIHHVCPGFYIESSGGVGAMITGKMMGLNVYFRYHDKTSAGNDTIYDGMARFGATEEVLQSTRVENDFATGVKQQMLEDPTCTYVKTPTAMFMELTLPVSEIVDGKEGLEETHYNDSILQAKFSIRKYNSKETGVKPLSPPSYLLMVRKSKMEEFFEEKKLPDSQESYLSNSYSTSSPIYQFSNVAQLITNLKAEREKGAGIRSTDSEAERKKKYEAWELLNPDWNKVYIIPVSATYTTSTNAYGTSTKTLQTITHELGMKSAKLEGGSVTPLQIEVTYGTYKK